jgi:transcription elongation factor GreA
VYFGATVKLLNMETGEEKKYKIVGPDETDVKIGKISIESPIAKSLMGRRCEDSVEVRTPKGLIEFEIQDIKYE